MNKLKENLWSLSFIKWIGLGVIMYLYGVNHINGLAMFSVKHSATYNGWDLIITSLSERYLITYFLFPWMIWHSVSFLLKDSDYHKLIRFGSYKNWIFYTLKNFLIMYGKLMFLWIAVIVILLIGMPFSLEWSELSQISDSSFGSQILEKHFNHPILALLSHIFLFTLSMVTTHLLLAMSYVVTKSRAITIFIMILSGFWVICAGKYLPESFAFLYPLNYFSLPIGIDHTGNSLIAFIVVGTVLLLSILIISQVDYNTQHVWSFIKDKGILLIFLFLISAILWKGTNAYGAQTIGDMFFYTFFGGSIEGFNFFNFLSYFILYFGFVYVVQLQLQKVLSQISHYMIIRYQSVNRWFWQWYRKVAFSILIYLIILGLYNFVIGGLAGGTLVFSTTFGSSFSTFDLYYQFFVNGYLQITFYVLLVFMISWLTVEPFYSLVAIGILSIFMFPGLNFIKVAPVGLNSLGYLTGHFPPYTISILLLFYILLEIGVLIHLLNRKDINL